MSSHEWYRDSKGRVDLLRMEVDPHYGPECMRCRESFCVMCEPEWAEEQCPEGDQLSLFEGEEKSEAAQDVTPEGSIQIT